MKKYAINAVLTVILFYSLVFIQQNVEYYKYEKKVMTKLLSIIIF